MMQASVVISASHHDAPDEKLCTSCQMSRHNETKHSTFITLLHCTWSCIGIDNWIWHSFFLFLRTTQRFKPACSDMTFFISKITRLAAHLDDSKRQSTLSKCAWHGLSMLSVCAMNDRKQPLLSAWVYYKLSFWVQIENAVGAPVTGFHAWHTVGGCMVSTMQFKTMQSAWSNMWPSSMYLRLNMKYSIFS